MATTVQFDFSVFPTLTTARLVLREVEPTDAAAVFAFRSDPEVQKHNGTPMQNIAEAEQLITDLRTVIFPNKYGIQWAVTQPGSDQVIGLFGLNYWDQQHRRIELGYDIAQAYWGQGFAVEGLKPILKWGFEQLNLNRVEAYTIADNHRSVRVLTKLGFTLEGTRRQYSLEDDGAFHGSSIYGLLREEYFA